VSDTVKPAAPKTELARDARPAPSPGIAQYDSRELFGQATEISIRHEHLVYRLKITRQGKLILNK
jgi:hemin uptake protein HemP